jgi:anti-sigma factor RsiW
LQAPSRTHLFDPGRPIELVALPASERPTHGGKVVFHGLSGAVDGIDSIHMSISQAGAAKQTSYWTGRTGYPPGLPVAWLDTRAGSLTLPTTLEPGRQYRLTAHGAFITGPAGAGAKPLADANCSTPSAYGWRAGGIRLAVDGSTAWTPALSSIPGCDLRNHTYSMMLTPSRAYRPVIRIVGDGDLSDNSNRVRITVTAVS